MALTLVVWPLVQPCCAPYVSTCALMLLCGIAFFAAVRVAVLFCVDGAGTNAGSVSLKGAGFTVGLMRILSIAVGGLAYGGRSLLNGTLSDQALAVTVSIMAFGDGIVVLAPPTVTVTGLGWTVTGLPLTVYVWASTGTVTLR